MFKPNLFIIAGCNGSGKSTFSASLLPNNLIPFDADKRKKEVYEAFGFDLEYREKMAWNKTQQEFENAIHQSISHRTDFSYETNFNYEPLFWINQFKAAGFNIHLMFFSLQSPELAIERVAIRYENGGHYVTNSEVIQRYHDGFTNLNQTFEIFDSIMILEVSTENEIPKTLIKYLKGTTCDIKKTLPDYFTKNCPQLSHFFVTN